MLADMIMFLRKAQGFTGGGYAEFSQSELIQFAVTWAYQTVGEIAKRFPDSFRTAHPEINWRQLIGFRDFLATTMSGSMLAPYGQPLRICRCSSRRCKPCTTLCPIARSQIPNSLRAEFAT